MQVKYSERSLAKVGVEIVDQDRVILRCKECGAAFSPMWKTGAKRMPKRWWRCHNGCNRPKVKCSLCERTFDPHLGLVRTCKECSDDYFLCFSCSEDFRGDVFPCCLVVIPGRRGVVPKSEAAQVVGKDSNLAP